MRVLVTGATGLVGSRLCARLLGRGDEVVGLTRKVARASAAPAPQDSARRIEWLQGDPVRTAGWAAALEGIDAVVHLAGEPIAAGRWSAARKRRLVSSRVDSTRAIAQALGSVSRRPLVLVSASASGYYGPREEEQLDERSAPGGDFLAGLCVDWEEAAQGAADAGVRVVALRMGVVLSASGGALERMLPPFRLGLGGPIGPPDRWLPWVHEEDVSGMLCLALDGDVSGPMNAVAPGSVRMRDFARALGRALRRPALLPLPEPLMRLALGEMAGALFPGQKIRPAAALEAGYEFAHPDLDGALQACLAPAR